MFGYMTEIEYVEMNDTQDIEAEGHDMLSLLFHFLDEFLFLFSAEPFFIARVCNTNKLSMVGKTVCLFLSCHKCCSHLICYLTNSITKYNQAFSRSTV